MQRVWKEGQLYILYKIRTTNHNLLQSIIGCMQKKNNYELTKILANCSMLLQFLRFKIHNFLNMALRFKTDTRCSCRQTRLHLSDFPGSHLYRSSQLCWHSPSIWQQFPVLTIHFKRIVTLHLTTICRFNCTF